MAGGPLAQFVPCMVCIADDNKLVKAVRTHEGNEDDQYRCPRGHTFGMDWRKPAEDPQWPPEQELIDELGPPSER